MKTDTINWQEALGLTDQEWTEYANKGAEITAKIKDHGNEAQVLDDLQKAFPDPDQLAVAIFKAGFALARNQESLAQLNMLKSLRDLMR